MEDFHIGKNLEGANIKGIDMSKVQDLFNEDEMIEEINPEDLVIEVEEEEKK